MKPDQKTIDEIKPLLGIFSSQIDNIVACFEDDSTNEAVDIPQTIQNSLFTYYVAGLMQPVTPGSKFNKEFKIK